MSDNKRPLGNFSQKNTTYSETSTSLNGNPVLKQDSVPNLQPSSLFSNNPINNQVPGTFVNKDKTIRAVRFGGEILNKKENATTLVQKELMARKNEVEKNIQQLLGAIHSIFTAINSEDVSDIAPSLDEGQDEVSLQEEIKNLIKKLEEASSLEKISEVGDDIKNLRDKIQVVQNIISRDQLIRAENLAELHPYISRFAVINDKVGVLLTKKIPNNIQIEIHELISSLDWLLKDPASGGGEMGIDEINKKIKSLKDLVEQENIRLRKEEVTQVEKAISQATNINQEALSLYKELLGLVEQYADFKKETEVLLLSNLDNIKKEVLQKKFNELKALREEMAVVNNTTKDSLEVFKGALDEYNLLIEEETSKEQTKPLDIWSDWRDLNLQIPPKEIGFWRAVEKNFNVAFEEYERFLERNNKNESNNKNKKIKEFPGLIAAKKAILDAASLGDIGQTARLTEVFRMNLSEVKDTWEEKIKKEEEVRLKNQEKNEGKKKLLEEFTKLKKLHTDTTPLYEEVMSKITSEEEHKFITKYFTGLATQSNELKDNLTNPNKEVTVDSLENFKLGINEFVDELAKIEKRLATIETRTGGRISPPLRTRFGTTNKTKEIILRDGRKISVEDWNKEQAAKYPHQNQSGEQTEEQKIEAFDKTLLQHKEMYTRNPKAYLELYSHKNWVAGDINKKASEELLTQQLASLNQAEDSLIQEIETLSAKLSTESEEEKNSISSQLEELRQKLQLTKEEIRSISEISYNQKIAFYKNQDTEKSLRRMKEVYSPAEDSSLNTSSTTDGKEPSTTIQINREIEEGYISEEEAVLQQEQLKLYKEYTAEIESIKEIIRRGTSDNIEADLQRIDEIKNKINLLIKKDASSVSMIEQVSPNHYSGMVRGLNEEEAVLKPGAYSVPNQVVINNPEKVIHRDVNSPEQVQKKRTMVGTLFETLTKNNLKKYGTDWRVWAIASVVAGAGLSTLIPNRKEDQVKSPQTLEQMMSWRDYLQTEESKKFTADFLDKKIGFEEIIKKYAKSAQLTSTNPESLRRLAVVEPYELLNNNTQEHIFGLSLEERKDLSQISLYLQTLVQATEAKNRMKSNFKQNDYSVAPPKVKLEEYFDIVLGIVTKVDEEEKKLKK